jgi:hypothetical protein
MEDNLLQLLKNDDPNTKLLGCQLAIGQGYTYEDIWNEVYIKHCHTEFDDGGGLYDYITKIGKYYISISEHEDNKIQTCISNRPNGTLLNRESDSINLQNEVNGFFDLVLHDKSIIKDVFAEHDVVRACSDTINPGILIGSSGVIVGIFDEDIFLIEFFTSNNKTIGTYHAMLGQIEKIN